jgi:hypothetical protein
MNKSYFTYDDAGNVLSCGVMAESLFAHHAEQTGRHVASVEDAKLANELRLYHHRYKMVDGNLALRDRDEIDAIERARLPKPKEGPTEMQELLAVTRELLAEMKALPERIGKVIEATWKA